MRRFFLAIVLGLLLCIPAYGASTKLEDESGAGSILNEDAAHSSGQPGIMALSVRKNTAAAVSGTDADYQPLITDTNGRLHVIDQYASDSNTSLTTIQQRATNINTTIQAWNVGGAINATIGRRITGNVAMVNAVTLDDSPTSVTSAGFPVQEYDKIAFFVTYDETEVGGGVSGILTLDVSYDNVTFLDASFYDYAGAATLQTSENITADGSYYCWFNKDITAPYVRAVFTGEQTDADDTIVVDVDMAAVK